MDDMITELKEEKTECMRRNVLGSRYKFTVEGNIGKVIQHYDKIYTSKLDEK